MLQGNPDRFLVSDDTVFGTLYWVELIPSPHSEPSATFLVHPVGDPGKVFHLLLVNEAIVPGLLNEGFKLLCLSYEVSRFGVSVITVIRLLRLWCCSSEIADLPSEIRDADEALVVFCPPPANHVGMKRGGYSISK
jgi:hypothetical protein